MVKQKVVYNMDIFISLCNVSHDNVQSGTTFMLSDSLVEIQILVFVFGRLVRQNRKAFQPCNA